MFNEARLLDCVAYGSQFGYRYNTRINELRNGVERRNAEWERPLMRGTVIFQNLRQGDADAVIAAHHACMGSLVGFRVKDWFDFKAENEFIGTATGVAQQMQLIKTYTFGSFSNHRVIYKPVNGTVKIFSNEFEIPATIDYTTGIVSFSAQPGNDITWSGEFDVPVRFEDDEMSFSIDNNSGEFVVNNDVGFIEVRL